MLIRRLESNGTDFYFSGLQRWLKTGLLLLILNAYKKKKSH